MDDEDILVDEDESEELDAEFLNESPHAPDGAEHVSKPMREKLAQDDAEIKAFERKLGIKKGRTTLPQAFKDDGLDELLGDFMHEDDANENEADRKRKQTYDDWLSSKRQKVPQSHSGLKGLQDGSPNQRSNIQDHSSSEDDHGMPLDQAASEIDEEDSDDEHSYESSEAERDLDPNAQNEILNQPEDESRGAFGTAGRMRENPYIAPTTGTQVSGKYVPPSLRRTAGSADESRMRLQKNLQGLINRLTDTNLLSIVASAEEIYQSNARGEVTEALTDTILAQIYKPEALPDQFFVLIGGFSAAVYKLIGSSFGSHLVRRVVKDFGENYDMCLHGAASDKSRAGMRKQTSNIVTFISQMYVFEMVSCKIIFDYMERLLEDLSELNVELLLRICRMAGRLLRRDDPMSLKHVTSILNSSVAKSGYANISVRTKFMIETIQDLKNSKPKAKGVGSNIVSEHSLRMKKRLGELKSQSRRLDGLAPMGMGLNDVEGAETQGKWWLVGASVATYRELSEREKATTGSQSKVKEPLSDNEDMDIVLPDYHTKARAQGLTTSAQIAIFTALMSAMDYEHGYRQYAALRLKRDDQLEIAKVLVQCVGSELDYNEYYALVGHQAASNGRVKFALQDQLWRIFRSLGEPLFGEDADEEETAQGHRMKEERRLSHVAHFYSALVANGSLTINILKPLEISRMTFWTSVFLEQFIVGLLRFCKGRVSSEDAKIERIFGPARDLPTLATGLEWYLRKKVRKSHLLQSKEKEKMDRIREKTVRLFTAD